jgi:hypothetical protein
VTEPPDDRRAPPSTLPPSLDAADDRLGPDEQTPLPVPETPLWRSLVRVLSNHIVALDDVKQRIGNVRDLIAARQSPPRAAELEDLGKAARAESDSATDVARAVEALERRRTARRAKHA